ncbi:CAAX prenyl protease 2 isoform X1 [Coccinella septempunctata]|uniref:CAAX prenyl protease 2 isoform X1 n=2 Tax=Coccinella septempunctata TaxID=41139 RepID=UPI001D07096E|nr:CAAX prenyl protease 2 isoform X1 [Coccinella septempunctata]
MELKCDGKFNCLISVLICFLLSVTYVGSLYIWRTAQNRDHPDVVKKRFISVFVMFFISPIFLYIGINKSILDQVPLNILLGLRVKGLLQGIFMPWFLTMILFLGPLAMQTCNGYLKLYTEPMHWISSFKNLLWIRNFLVAPLSEEFTFRSCMMPLLLQCFPPMTVVFTAPLFFGTAHFHHLQERRKMGFSFKSALQISCFQFVFTTLFGAYSAFIFLRTGHFASIFVVHAFCNHMGFPNFEEVANYKGPKKVTIISLFFVGLISWCYLLFPLTEPSWYYNESPWTATSS